MKVKIYEDYGPWWKGIHSDGRRPPQIACIHDEKFLSLDHGEGKIMPLIGSAEPENTADQQKRGGKDR